jgi:hypothetical protein
MFTGGIGPITLTWKKLNVYGRPERPNRLFGLGKTVPQVQTVQGKGKQILFNITGIAKPGQLIAVMGAR